MIKMLLILIITISIQADNLAWVDEQINAIKPNRDGISVKGIDKTRSPFIFIQKDKSVKKGSNQKAIYKTVKNKDGKVIKKRVLVKKEMKLKAIINYNALIDKTWVKVDDIFKGYRVIKIDDSFVVLKKGSKTKKLSIKKSSNKIKFGDKK
ncbi:MAG: hypothetical protein U9N42_02725 [Campylobacterota bacterium]|nr:hypothetical protein [Campylobacterota bacterium]